MNITKDLASPTEAILNVELDSEDEEPFISRSYRRLVSRVRIPGFRPGKAPRSILESHLGRAALVQEALEFMVPETLDKILKDENLQAYMEPELEILEMEPVSFKAVVPLEPVVELGDIRSIRLERQPVEITDEQLNQVIERIRSDSAPWEPVERPVQFGDLLSLDANGIIDGEEAIKDEGIDFIPEVDNQLPIPGFSVYLEGMTEGQEKDFTLTIPAEHHQEQYAGKECRVHVKILSIKEKRLPELDDEFAKGVRDGYESMDALAADLRQQLVDAAEHAATRQAEQDSLEELMKISTIQASDMIYQRELDSMYEDRARSARNQRLDMDTYLSRIGQTEEEWREQLKPQAEQRLNTYLVLRKLARDEGIDIDPEEIQGEINSMVNQSGDSEESMRRVLSSDNAKDSIRMSLMNRKVMQRLVEIIEGRGESSESADDGAVVEPEEQTAVATLEPAAEQEATQGTAGATGPAPEANDEGAEPNAE